MHVLDMLWILRVHNMSMGMLCALWNIHNMEGYEQGWAAISNVPGYHLVCHMCNCQGIID